MDAAQMLTVHEIARQCQEMARTAGQREAAPDSSPRGHLRPVDAPTEPLPRVPPEPSATDDRANAERVGSADRELDDRELSILAFERQWWKCAGGKERAVRELFDMSGTRYHQVLNALLDDPAAARVDPMLVKRLRKVRASRQRARQARRLGIEWH
ncbi:DUF3263 domain-containing protein [Saccharopolyspora sp. MS10]|uniref:DUF3263 domain-containing protein n=1 Tax=Saccharopolyspora sp. MS10 TaxID=3385973 RepID=UPI00399F8788